jgi:tetratricopeptide (TPR) repeat protein
MSSTAMSDDSSASLIEQARRARNSGDHQAALALLREAVARDPEQEAVWLALLDVMDRPEDRRVCLENIIAINPKNLDARRMLQALIDAAALAREEAAREAERRKARRALNRRSFFRGVRWGIGVALVGMLLGVIVSIIVYGVLPAG